MSDESHFQRLMKLLVKIEQSKRHVELRIKFDGNRFKWDVTFGGLAAEEWDPQKQFPPASMVD